MSAGEVLGGSGDEACRVREVTGHDGASFRFCAHGGHVLGWTPAGGQERLWLSRTTGCGPGAAVRGGVPVVWPQFAERGDGPRHGVARDRAWQVLHAGPGPDGAATARLRLLGDGSEPPVPHVFTLELDVTAAAATLALRLSVVNEGAEAFSFAAALHTYLRVSTTAAATLHGLDGLLASPNGGGPPVAVTGPLGLLGPLDVEVAGVDRPLLLRDPVLGDVRLEADGFGSRVVWNPGPGQAPGDVHPGGEGEFVCVEPARLDPVTLEPGARWSATEVLTALPPS